MKIGVLTSSRADYGIYQPLLKKLDTQKKFEVEIIVFGMHLQASQGNTIEEILKDGKFKLHTVGSMPSEDSIEAISRAYGKIVEAFSCFWLNNKYDLVFALGDRWEMSAAVQASIPFEVKLAHIHGGETTYGATDNIYRHQISLASTYHFTASKIFTERIKSLIGHDNNIYTVGSISLEGVERDKLPEWQEIKKKFDIPFNEFILTTIHPESVDSSQNTKYSRTIFSTIKTLSSDYNFLITGTNSDALGSLYKTQFEKLENLYPKRIKLITSLGKLNYFKAMDRCLLMLGNTSSGIIEAASFNKWVINLGDRQKGRLRSENVIDIPFDESQIIDSVKAIIVKKPYAGINKYFGSSPSDDIIKIVSNHVRHK